MIEGPDSSAWPRGSQGQLLHPTVGTWGWRSVADPVPPETVEAIEAGTAWLEVSAPSRVHLGLLPPGEESDARRGGMGLMVATPSLRLAVGSSGHRPRHARGHQAHESLDAERIETAIARWLAARPGHPRPTVPVKIVAGPSAHSGLGSGTQLTLAVAWSLDQLIAQHQRPRPTWAIDDWLDWSLAFGRGRRSLVGSAGFAFGGIVYDTGQSGHGPTETSLMPWHASRSPASVSASGHCVLVNPPVSWRVFLVRPRGNRMGLFGAAEEYALSTQGMTTGGHPRPRPNPSCPNGNSTVTQDLDALAGVAAEVMRAEAAAILAGAVGDGDAAVPESVGRYGRAAGAVFAPVQGGLYNGEDIAAVVQAFTEMGILGVGQSSWGPTVFVLAVDQATAQSVLEILSRDAVISGDVMSGDGVAPESGRGRDVSQLIAPDWCVGPVARSGALWRIRGVDDGDEPHDLPQL